MGMSTLEYRTRTHKSQSELGLLVGVTASVISQWESGKKNPSYETLKKLLELGATVEELFGIDCSKTCPKAQLPTASPETGIMRILERLDALEDSKRNLDQRKAG